MVETSVWDSASIADFSGFWNCGIAAGLLKRCSAELFFNSAVLKLNLKGRRAMRSRAQLSAIDDYGA
jgi:hypothetical protein